MICDNETRVGCVDEFDQTEGNKDVDSIIKEAHSNIKPIFVVRVPYLYITDTPSYIDMIKELVNTISGDYYVIITTEKDLSAMQFELFSIHSSSLVSFEVFTKIMKDRFVNTNIVLR